MGKPGNPAKANGRPKLSRNLKRYNEERLRELMADVKDLEDQLKAGAPDPDLAEIHLLYRAAAAALLTVHAIAHGETRPVDLLAGERPDPTSPRIHRNATYALHKYQTAGQAPEGSSFFKTGQGRT